MQTWLPRTDDVLAVLYPDRTGNVLNICPQSLRAPSDDLLGGGGGAGAGKRGGRTDRASAWKAAGPEVCRSRWQAEQSPPRPPGPPVAAAASVDVGCASTPPLPALIHGRVLGHPESHVSLQAHSLSEWSLPWPVPCSFQCRRSLSGLHCGPGARGWPGHPVFLLEESVPRLFSPFKPQTEAPSDQVEEERPRKAA